MSTLIINGSPKGKNGNTEVFVRHFNRGFKEPCKVCYAAKESGAHLAAYIRHFDTVILVMPLYIHAMPGIVMKLLECMEPAGESGKAMGFIVQSGFMESAQSKYLERYLSALAKSLNYAYLGTVVRGGSAGVSVMPEKINRKLFSCLRALGEHFELDGTFDKGLVKRISRPLTLSKAKCGLLQFMARMGLGDCMYWNHVLKSSKAFDKRFDRPFAGSATQA